MKLSRLFKIYGDPAIGSPALGWAVRCMRTKTRGFGAWHDGCLHIGFWQTCRIELVRLPGSK